MSRNAAPVTDKVLEGTLWQCLLDLTLASQQVKGSIAAVVSWAKDMAIQCGEADYNATWGV